MQPSTRLPVQNRRQAPEAAAAATASHSHPTPPYGPARPHPIYTHNPGISPKNTQATQDDMKILTFIKHMAFRLCMVSVGLLALASCQSWIYEDEGDCTVRYRLRFRYEMNLKWADAFANEVTSVHLYAFDRDGILVWQQSERIAAATAGDYSMELGLAAGDYRLLAWCGLVNDGAAGESFTVPEAVEGQTRIEELQCSLSRLRDRDGAYSKDRLYRLFHGTMEVSLPDSQDGRTYDYTMYLTKDTNHVRVILQHLSGKDVDADQFTFRIHDDNGLMAHDNSLVTDETIGYRPWATRSGQASIGKDDTRAIISVNGAIADFTVGRLTEEHRHRMLLTISSDGHTVATIPVIDYALLAREYYQEEYGHEMSEQEFLDREDDYVLTLFLDENNEWISSQILIHAWRIVPSNVEIE